MDTPEASKYRNPADYVKVIFRRKALIIVPTYIGLVIGIMLCLLMPPTWESSTIILVEEEKIINPLIQNLAVSTSARQRMESIREVLLGWNSLVDMARKLKLDQKVRNQQEFEDLITTLRNNIKVTMRPPNVIVLSYLSQDRKEAQLVAKTLSDILIERNMKTQAKETDVAITFITEQLGIYKRKIKESEIADLQEQLKALLVDSTEEHPMVKELRGKIAVATKELESGEYEVKGAGVGLDGKTREALEKELDKMLNVQPEGPVGGILSQADAGASLYKLMLMDKVNTARAQDMNVNQTIYNMLLQRLETAKITQRLESSREGTRYTVLDPPRLPLKPVKPNKPLIILIGFLAGLGCGVGLAFLAEFMDQSVLDVEDAKLSFAYPVLGAIPRITTVDEVARERRAAITATVISVISGMALVIIALLVSFMRGISNV